MFTFVRVLLLLVEKQKQAKDYSQFTSNKCWSKSSNISWYFSNMLSEYRNILQYASDVLWDSPRKRALMSYANSKGPDQHVHTCSLIWAFCNCWQCTGTTVSIDSVSGQWRPDEPARMRRLIWACIVHRLHNGAFSSVVHHLLWHFYILQYPVML